METHGGKNREEAIEISTISVPNDSYSPDKVVCEFRKLSFEPDVDGLRAVAIVPVILYHFNLAFPGTVGRDSCKFSHTQNKLSLACLHIFTQSLTHIAHKSL